MLGLRAAGHVGKYFFLHLYTILIALGLDSLQSIPNVTRLTKEPKVDAIILSFLGAPKRRSGEQRAHHLTNTTLATLVPFSSAADTENNVVLARGLDTLLSMECHEAVGCMLTATKCDFAAEIA